MINKQNSKHYRWGNNCDCWIFHDSIDLSIKLESMPPDTSEEWHYHDYAQQFFFIRKGKATFLINHKMITVAAGEGINIQAKEHHLIKNEQEESLEFLVISCPSSANDRFSVSKSDSN